MNRRREPRSQRERGASLIMALVFMLVAVSSLALVVDTARLYVEKRKLQRVADLAALDASLRSGACGSGRVADALALAQTSATRNGYTGSLSVAPNVVELGYLTASGGVRSFQASAAQREAVRVRVTQSVPASLLAGGLFAQRILLSAEATARRSPTATLAAGTSLLSVNTAQSPLLNGILGGLLGTSLNLSAVSYDGIAKADLTVLAFLNGLGLVNAQVGVGSVTDLLNTTVTTSQVINALLNPLIAQGNTGATLLKAQLSGSPALTLKLAEILNIDTTGAITRPSQLGVNINALDLLLATAQIANKNTAVSVNLGLPGLANASLRVIDPLMVTVGPPGQDASGNWRTQIKQSQVKLSVDVAPSLLGLVSTAPLTLSVDSAAGRVRLTEMACRTADKPRTDVTVTADTNAAIVKLGAKNNTAVPTPFSLVNVNVLGLLGAQVKGNLQLTANVGNSSNLSWTFPVSNEATDLPAVKTLGSGVDITSVLNTQLALTGLQVCVSVLGIPLCTPSTGQSLNTLINTVLPLLTVPLNTVVLTPVLTTVLPLLGVRLGSIDVSLLDIDVGGAELVQ